LLRCQAGVHFSSVDRLAQLAQQAGGLVAYHPENVICYLRSEFQIVQPLPALASSCQLQMLEIEIAI
jgi:hypothetical protein